MIFLKDDRRNHVQHARDNNSRSSRLVFSRNPKYVSMHFLINHHATQLCWKKNPFIRLHHYKLRYRRLLCSNCTHKWGSTHPPLRPSPLEARWSCQCTPLGALSLDIMVGTVHLRTYSRPKWTDPWRTLQWPGQSCTAAHLSSLTKRGKCSSKVVLDPQDSFILFYFFQLQKPVLSRFSILF